MNLLLLFAFLVFGIATDRILRKKLKIEKGTWSFLSYVNKVHKWIELTSLIIFVFLLWYVKDFFPLIISFYIIMTLLRAFMEWKYERATKEYIMTLFTFAEMCVFISIIFSLN